MDREIIINVGENSLLRSSEEILVEVRGRPPSRGDHVILASGSQTQMHQQLHIKSEIGQLGPLHNTNLFLGFSCFRII